MLHYELCIFYKVESNLKKIKTGKKFIMTARKNDLFNIFTCLQFKNLETPNKYDEKLLISK